MPVIHANGIEMYYEVQGEGEPLVLIPYGAGLSGKPDGEYSTELLAEDVAAFMEAAGVGTAHVAGMSLGAAVGTWLAAKHPTQVKSLSLHSAWTATDPFLRAIVESWRIMARGLDSVPEMVIKGIFPWCFTPELYAARPEYIDSLADFVRGRPMPDVAAFLRQSGAVLAHDARPALALIQAPTLLTFGDHDMVTSTRFATPLTDGISGAELIVFSGAAHAPMYEVTEEFNERTLDFLRRHSG